MHNRFFVWIFATLLLACNSENGNKTEPVPEPMDSVQVLQPNINPYSFPDISPMDMVYFPQDYTKLKMAKKITSPPVMRVIYSRPHLQGRKLFKDLQQYGDYWRLGANEATEIEFFRDVTIQNKEIKQGRYVMYCIPKENVWTIFFNSNIDSWGLVQDITRNVSFFEIPVTDKNPHAEYLTMWFEKSGNGADLVMAWDDLQSRLPIQFN